MANYRSDRVNEEIMREMADILRTVKDPRVSSCFVSITRVDCTQDLKFCKIYFSVIGEGRKGDCGKGLKQASGYIRCVLAEKLNLRITPELTFVEDNSIKEGARIAELLKQIEN